MFGFWSAFLEVRSPVSFSYLSPLHRSLLPFYELYLMQYGSALFQYPGFTVSYESGIDHVPRFDASIEIFGKFKTIKICYDTPYVKGLPTTMELKELGTNGEYIHSTVRRTYEDPYTLEMKELYAAVVDGKAIKTTAQDARKEVEIFQMIMAAGVERSTADL